MPRPTRPTPLPWRAGSPSSTGRSRPRSGPPQLGLEDAARLAAELLGPGDPERAARVASESQGNPFFVGELARRAGDLAVAEVSLDEAVAHRVGALPAAQRRLLEAVAVAGCPVALSVAAASAGVDDDLAGAVAALRAAHLLRAAAGETPEVESYHDRIRESVTAAMSAEARQACHERLADALEADGDADPELLANHLGAAGHPERAAPYAARAARAAVGALAFDRAARLFRQALAGGGHDAPTELALRVGLAEALTYGGSISEAGEAYAAAAPLAPADEAWDLRRLAAEHLLLAGRTAEGRPILEEVLREVGWTIPRSRLRTLLAVLWRLTTYRVFGFRHRDRTTAEPRSHDLRAWRAAWTTAMVLVRTDPLSAFYVGTGLRRTIERLGDVAISATHLYLLAIALTMVSMRGAARFLELAEGLADRTRDPMVAHYRQHWRGLYMMQGGSFPAALPYLERAEALLLEMPRAYPADLASTRILANIARVCGGQLHDLAMRLPAQLAEAERQGATLGATSLALASAVWPALADDDPASAREALEAARARGAPWSATSAQAMYYRFSRAALETYEGRAAEHLEADGRLLGWDRRRAAHPIASGAFNSRIAHVALRLGALSEGRGPAAEHRAQALGTLADLRRSDRRTRSGVAPAFDLHFRGCLAALDGEADRAVALLAEAETALAAHGFQPYAAAARYRRGQLLGGDEGRHLRDGAEAFFASQRLRSTERFLRWLAPGRGT